MAKVFSVTYFLRTTVVCFRDSSNPLPGFVVFYPPGWLTYSHTLQSFVCFPINRAETALEFRMLHHLLFWRKVFRPIEWYCCFLYASRRFRAQSSSFCTSSLPIVVWIRLWFYWLEISLVSNCFESLFVAEYLEGRKALCMKASHNNQKHNRCEIGKLKVPGSFASILRPFW